jgi:hypothetical protein
MTILSEDMRNVLADAYGDEAAFFSLHDGNPGSGGSNEISGGGYTREAASWGSSSGGQVQASAVFDLPISEITYAGVWNSTETVFLDSFAFDVTQSIGIAGQRQLNVTFTVM